MEPQQVDIGSEFHEQSEDVLAERIVARKEELGEKLLILCHHYQQESVYRFADMTGDSLKLAKHAAACDDKPFIVFCGVHFMAESADILTGNNQSVILPDLRAGCPMADMASIDEVTLAWKEMAGVTDAERVIPVTYVNSSAAIKAFVGERQGSVCTSSNAERVLTWALERGDKVFFFPDEHLGRFTAKSLGLQEHDLLVWDPFLPNGGHTPEAIRHATVLLWKGFCSVHQMFRPEHVRGFRSRRVTRFRVR